MAKDFLSLEVTLGWCFPTAFSHQTIFATWKIIHLSGLSAHIVPAQEF